MPLGAHRLQRLAWSARSMLPRGRLLPEEVWERRHRLIVRLALLQALALVVLAAALHGGPVHSSVEGLLVALPALPALSGRLGRQARAICATTSLFAASAVLVHVAHGVTEAHFHFFIMVAVVALYQDWAPFGVGIAIVLAHHGIAGLLDPEHVFSTPAAQRSPLLWAGIHAGSVLAAATVSLAAWRLSEQQGLHDPLTRLPNRTLLSERLRRRVGGEGQPTSVLFVDLDDFKTVNDSRGHWVGDRVLLAVADRLLASVRPGDTVARLGGDEFAVIVAGPPSAGAAVAGRVVAALEAPIDLDGTPIFVRGSVGLAHAGDLRGRTADDLLREADLAMYEAKAGGKNRVAVFAERMDLAVRRRAELSADLAGAVGAGQLELHYQPTVRLRDGRPTGAEALLRWRHPTRGLMQPAEFVALAEDSRLIVGIGEWVLRTALDRIGTWRRSHPELGDLGLAVNLSAAQLEDEGLVEVVADALAASGLPPCHLTLEITESVLASDMDAVAACLGRLRALGVMIAIDDFGTGYSSLSYLRRLPVDVLKIDRSFVAELDVPGVDALVSSILDLAGALGLDVVAEGVETEAQAERLRAQGCHAAQGFLYGRPLPPGDVEALLAAPCLPHPGVVV